MNILPEKNDADSFIAQVDALANGIFRAHTPDILILVKVNSWFGSRWLGFSGKILGTLGVWQSVRSPLRAVTNSFTAKIHRTELFGNSVRGTAP
jgi:hypothetical protein